jgi:hypothetical protein
MTLTPGKTMLATGVLHELVGLLVGLGIVSPSGGLGRNLVLEIARDGFVGAVEVDAQRQAFFWYFFFGLLLMSLGWLMDHLETPERPLPAALGWQLIALALAGGLLIPASGFWLALPQGVWVLWRARAAAVAAPGRARLSAP